MSRTRIAKRFFSAPRPLRGEIPILLATDNRRLATAPNSLLIPCFCSLKWRKPAIHAASYRRAEKIPCYFPVIPYSDTSGSTQDFFFAVVPSDLGSDLLWGDA